jgi:hypothetical protein
VQGGCAGWAWALNWAGLDLGPWLLLAPRGRWHHGARCQRASTQTRRARPAVGTSAHATGGAQAAAAAAWRPEGAPTHLDARRPPLDEVGGLLLADALQAFVHLRRATRGRVRGEGVCAGRRPSCCILGPGRAAPRLAAPAAGDAAASAPGPVGSSPGCQPRPTCVGSTSPAGSGRNGPSARRGWGQRRAGQHIGRPYSSAADAG